MDLRQSTASQEISLGQFLDDADGNTEENGLTIANTDIKIRKHGTTTLANKNSGGATSISNGVYHSTLDATDTNTAGMLEIYVHVAGALAVKTTFDVLTQSAFDAKYTGVFNNVASTDIVSGGAITTSAGTVLTVTNLTNQSGRIATGTAQAATSATIQLAIGETFANDEIIGATVIVTGGTTGVGQSRIITDYVGSTDTATVDTWTTTPTGTITYDVIATPPSSVSSPADVNVTQILGTAITETSGGRIANNFDFFYDNSNAQTTKTVDDVGVAGSGLTQQNVADAMKLTPTAGAPSAGSVNEHLDDILTDTGTTLDGKINTIDTNVDAILVDTGTTIPGTISALNDFDPGSDTVANVTTVATTTTNSDMRGTDSAATAANLATVDSNVDAILVDTGTIIPATLGSPAGADMSTDIAAVKSDTAAILVDTSTTLPDLIDDLAIKKNTIFNNFEFLMVLATDGRTPALGLTITGQRSVDGGAFVSVAGSFAEVSNGIYQFDAAAADTNGDVITWRFLSATADDTFVTFKTVQ